MKALRSFVAVAALLTLVGYALSADAQEMKHSGTIVSVNEDAGTIVLAEIGPWEVRKGETVITYRTIRVTPETGFTIAGRRYATFESFPGEYVEDKIDPWAVYPDDYVTIDCRHEGKRLLALKITVVEVAAP